MEAIQYGHNIKKIENEDEDYLPGIFQLLAYEKPEESPLKELFSAQQREKIADMVNEAIVGVYIVDIILNVDKLSTIVCNVYIFTCVQKLLSTFHNNVDEKRRHKTIIICHSYIVDIYTLSTILHGLFLDHNCSDKRRYGRGEKMRLREMYETVARHSGSDNTEVRVQIRTFQRDEISVKMRHYNAVVDECPKISGE